MTSRAGRRVEPRPLDIGDAIVFRALRWSRGTSEARIEPGRGGNEWRDKPWFYMDLAALSSSLSRVRNRFRSVGGSGVSVVLHSRASAMSRGEMRVAVRSLVCGITLAVGKRDDRSPQRPAQSVTGPSGPLVHRSCRRFGRRARLAPPRDRRMAAPVVDPGAHGARHDRRRRRLARAPAPLPRAGDDLDSVE